MLIDFAEACEKLKFSPMYIEINARFQLLMHLKHFLLDFESFLYNTHTTVVSNRHKKAKNPLFFHLDPSIFTNFSHDLYLYLHFCVAFAQKLCQT